MGDANDKAGTVRGGGVSAGVLTLREEAVEESGSKMEVHAAFGPNADAFAPQAASKFAW